ALPPPPRRPGRPEHVRPPAAAKLPGPAGDRDQRPGEQRPRGGRDRRHNGLRRVLQPGVRLPPTFPRPARHAARAFLLAPLAPPVRPPRPPSHISPLVLQD